MNRWPILIVAVLVVLLAVPIAFGTPAVTTEQDAGKQSGATVSSALSVYGATIDRSIETTALEIRFREADTPSERAAVGAAALDRVDARLAPLEARLDTLRAARENGSIEADTYARQVAPLAASARSLDALVGQVRTATDGLDAETRRDAGVSRDRIETLQSRAERVAAADEGVITADGLGSDFYRRITAVAEAYNDNAGTYDLGVLGTHLNDERINIRITREDGGTEVVSIRTTGDVRIRDLRAGRHPGATVRVRLDESTARQVLNSDTPGQTANRAFLRGEIRIDGLGLYNAIKWFIVNVALGVVRALVGLIEWVLSLP